MNPRFWGHYNNKNSLLNALVLGARFSEFGSSSHILLSLLDYFFIFIYFFSSALGIAMSNQQFLLISRFLSFSSCCKKSVFSYRLIILQISIKTSSYSLHYNDSKPRRLSGIPCRTWLFIHLRFSLFFDGQLIEMFIGVSILYIITTVNPGV